MEYLIVAVVVIGLLMKWGTIKVPKFKLGTGAATPTGAAAAPVAKKGLSATAKMMIAFTVIIILLLWGDQIWGRMDGVWKDTALGAILEKNLGAGWANALWLLLLIPFAFFLNGKGAGATATASTSGGKPLKTVQDLFWIILGIAALWYGYQYFTNSGNVVVDLWHRTTMVVNMPANRTLEIKLPPGGCRADYYVTESWRLDYGITEQISFDHSSSEQNYFHYVTVAEPRRSQLLKDEIPIEIKVDKIGC